jgi:hypothetical protein
MKLNYETPPRRPERLFLPTRRETRLAVRIAAGLATLAFGVLTVTCGIELLREHEWRMIPAACASALGAFFLGCLAFERQR